MDIQALIKNLHPLEVKVLLTYKTGEELTSARLQADLHYKEGHANQAFSWLAGKNLVQVRRKEMHTYYELTELGFSFAKNGQPAERIFNFETLKKARRKFMNVFIKIRAFFRLALICAIIERYILVEERLTLCK